MQADETAEAPDDTDARGENRFHISSKATEVTLTFTIDGETKVLAGRLADLSARGAKVTIDGRVARDTEVELTVFVRDIDFKISRMALVRWQQPRDAVSWWTGCKVPAGFDDDVIEGLAAANVLNRRRDPRHRVGKPVQIQWELSDEVQTVELVNYSKGGFCLQMDSSDYQDGARLQILIPDESDGSRVAIPGRVMWQQKKGSKHAVGCELITMQGFVALRDFAKPGEVVARHRRDQKRRRLRRPMSKWFAIAVLLLASTQAIHAIDSSPDLWTTLRGQWEHFVVAPIRAQMIRVTDDGEVESDAPARLEAPVEPPNH